MNLGLEFVLLEGFRVYEFHESEKERDEGEEEEEEEGVVGVEKEV